MMKLQIFQEKSLYIVYKISDEEILTTQKMKADTAMTECYK